MTAIDSASLRAFRVMFGLLMAVGMARFFIHGWIEEFFVQPAMHFTYTGWDWIRPWPAWGMYLHAGVVGVAALAVAAGFYYRQALFVFLLGFGYLELIDKTTYLNHYYLVTLLASLMLFIPLDRRRAGLPVAAWQLNVMRWQVGLVYFFAGVAKLKPDWLIDAQPLQIWFAASTDVPVIGPFLALPAAPWIASWAGMLMDLTAPFFLSWRRTRTTMFLVIVVFHVTTAALFNLGLFPWLMIAAATLFFSPAWPFNLMRIGRRMPNALRAGHDETFRHAQREARWASVGRRKPSSFLATSMALYFAFQIGWPLRHLAYPTDVLWAEDGYRFSWNVMLMEKSGYIAFVVRDPATGRTWRAQPRDDLSPLQVKMMATQPDMILQYAHWLAQRTMNDLGRPVQVFADSWVSLNGRAGRPLIDPEVDLVSVAHDFGARWWVSSN